MPRAPKIDNDTYLVTCEGQYYAMINGHKEYKDYRIQVQLPGSAKGAGFLSVIRNEILSNQIAMQRKFVGWKRFRTHVITDVKNLTKGGKQVRELRLMNRAQIVLYIESKGFEIDTDLYETVTDLRQALVDYRADEDAFLAQQEKKRLLSGNVIKIRRQVARLNEWLNEDTQDAETPQTEASQDNTQTAAPPPSQIEKPRKPRKYKAPEKTVQELAATDPAYDPYDAEPTEGEASYDDPELEDISQDQGIPEYDDEDELAAILGDI